MLTHSQRCGNALITAGFLLSASTMLQAAEYRYSIIIVGNRTQQVAATAINNSGVIYGTFNPPGLPDGHAMHLSLADQSPIDMGALYASSNRSWINAASDTGWAVGVSSRISYYEDFATIWRPVAGGHEIIDPGHLDIGPCGEALGVNNDGQVVGYSRPSTVTDRRAFLWQAGALTSLPALENADIDTLAVAINALGHIVGSSQTTDVRELPVIWTDDDGDGAFTIEELGSLTGYHFGNATAINDLDEVVGDHRSNSFRAGHAFYWSRETGFLDIHDPPFGGSSSAIGINNQSEVVGTVGTGVDFPYRAYTFHWTAAEGMIDLNDYIPPRSNVEVRGTAGINDSGQIVVNASSRDRGLSNIYVLSPVHPTMTLDTLGHGGDLIAGSRNALRITGATPGSSVTFYWSERGGGTAIPGCDLQVNSLQITAPLLIGTAVADASGSAIIDRVIPNAARDKIVLLQAAVPGECAVSQLLVKQIH